MTPLGSHWLGLGAGASPPLGGVLGGVTVGVAGAFTGGLVGAADAVFFEAVRGSGGTARLVLLPFEDHGYRARESVEHVLWEQIRWFDEYVKNAE